VSGHPNILLLVADDMNWDAVGAYGCETPGTTPNIDRLASEGIRFNLAHVTISVCQPSRSTLMTGLYPHNNGGEGFYHLRYPHIPILPEILASAGYRTGILGKVKHSTPHQSYKWDFCHDKKELGMGRNPHIYRQYAARFIRDSLTIGKPFFLMANSHDPHRPFFGNDSKEWYLHNDPPAVPPSATFKAKNVVTPGFLEDLPEVRLEISEYYNSVRRCDDTVGELLDEINKQGIEEDTIVVFLSDNGMSFPFAKTNCYLHSTKTPWIMRWPNIIAGGSVDNDHFISGIDLMPTLLDAVDIHSELNMDGSSFLPIIHGETQGHREFVFTQFHQTAVKRNYPMRCVQDRRFGYIFNPWSDGIRTFRNESLTGRTFKAMSDAAEKDDRIMQRVNLCLYRVPEELYDFQNDPNAQQNLIDNPEYTQVLKRLHQEMESHMIKTHDPALDAFRNRYKQSAIDALFNEMVETIGGV